MHSSFSFIDFIIKICYNIYRKVKKGLDDYE